MYGIGWGPLREIIRRGLKEKMRRNMVRRFRAVGRYVLAIRRDMTSRTLLLPRETGGLNGEIVV